MIEQKNILLSEIKPDPNQPRKYYDEAAMLELAESVREKGVVQPITVRPNGKGYLLVCGERRYRAAMMVMGVFSDRNTIPAVVRELSDEEALEIQIIENVQRENVHPMEEAVAFKSLIEKGKELKEVAARVGKNEYYVRQRMRLNSLTKNWQTAFYQDRVSVKDALEIGSFDSKVQDELWKENGNGDGRISLNSWYLNRFKGDLGNASFALDDPTLDKKAGPCTSCQFNSAVASLFPDAAMSPRCSKVSCFKHKSDIHFEHALKRMLEDPEVILVNPEYSSYEDNFTRKLEKEGHKILNGRSKNNFEVIEAPERPNLDDYDPDDFDSEKDRMKDFNDDLSRYERELKEFNSKVEGGKYKKAFAIHGSNKGKIVFISFTRSKPGSSKATKENEASGKLSTADIDDEISRIKERNKRSKEIDGEKVQKRIIEAVKQDKSVAKVPERCESIDRVLIRFLLQDHISYQNRDKISKAIGLGGVWGTSDPQKLWDKLATLTDQQVTYLVRQILIDKHASENPRGTSGFIFRKMAASLGTIPIDAFVQEQNEAAEKRDARVAARIKQLQDKKREVSTNNSSKKKAAKK